MGRSRCTYCAMRGGSSVLLLSAAVAGRWEVGLRVCEFARLAMACHIFLRPR
eukprot:SAG25_NODE_2295_length_1743_cov_2.142336_1_plen_51_part_10